MAIPVLSPNNDRQLRLPHFVEASVDRIVEQFKKGYKTTEFWVTLLTGGLILIEGTTGLDLDNDSIIALAVSNFGYVAGRSYLKGKRVDAVAIQE